MEFRALGTWLGFRERILCPSEESWQTPDREHSLRHAAIKTKQAQKHIWDLGTGH